ASITPTSPKQSNTKCAKPRIPSSSLSAGQPERGPSGPELIRCVQVTGIGPYLGGLAVRDVEDLHGVVLQAPALALGADRNQRDRVLVAGDHVVHLDGDGSPAGLICAQKPSLHLIDAVIVTAERALARIMPPDVLGEEPSLQRADITVPEERICIPQQ